MGDFETRGASRTPRLAIGLPVHNGERYVSQAIDSLLGQTFTDFTLIVSDNGSTDATEEICRAYARRDARIRYHRSDENRGAAWNFNRVFELADSPYFKWAAYDDLCAPHFVERCIEFL
jgi:glycosyltransferase involved in cell wall biosynthesis